MMLEYITSSYSSFLMYQQFKIIFDRVFC